MGRHVTWGVRRRAGTPLGRPPAAIGLALTALMLAGCSATAPGGARTPRTAGTSATVGDKAPPTATSAPAVAPAVLAAANPTAVEIPAIGVRAPVRPVGVNPDGTVQVPPLQRPGEVGWYSFGPTPGELGPAVLLGHVDGKSGPAVFYRLPELHPGDTIHVTRDDGRTAMFRVATVERVPKSAFPTGRVYGDLDHAGLRLITCGGSFDERRHSYTDNFVVFADFTGATPGG